MSFKFRAVGRSENLVGGGYKGLEKVNSVAIAED